MPTPLLPDEPLADLASWEALGGGAMLRLAVEDADAVLDAVDRAGLRGRGGAGFPTARKWRSILDAARDTDSTPHIVANAAEGEPGTFKDRPLIRHNPYALLEGLLVGMHVLRAPAAHVGIKARFEPEVARLEGARTELVEAGWAGADRIEIVEGPDSYLFGEESALLEVIEGRDPLPRILKPFELGLGATADGRRPNPTVVNNAESLVHVARIGIDGAEAFRAEGTEASPGRMLFTVVGDVASPGVYELPLGVTLGELLVDIAGAVDPKLVVSGVSNGVMTPAHLDVPLCFDALREAGGGLGSGGFVVYDQGRSVVRVIHALADFLARESCGQCGACSLGTADVAELLRGMCEGDTDIESAELMVRRAMAMADQNRCWLPMGGQLLVTSAVSAFPDEFVAALSGPPGDADRDYPVPLIDDIDEQGNVVWHDLPERPREADTI